MNTCVLAQQTPLQRAPRERASGAMPRHRKTGIKRPSLKLFDMCEHVHKALPRLSMGYEPQQNDQPTDGLSNPIALSPRPTAVLARRSASREGGSVQQHFIPCAAFVFLPSFFSRPYVSSTSAQGIKRNSLGGEMMRYFIVVLLLAVCTAQAEDYVTIKYQPGMSMSDRPVTITVSRPFDKSGTLIPSVFKKLKAINGLKTRSFVVPDAAYITIIAEVDGQRLESSSCHTLFEANPKLVARSTGISSLDGAPREKALSSEPKDLMDFRRLWEECLSIALTDVTETFSPQQGGGHVR